MNDFVQSKKFKLILLFVVGLLIVLLLALSINSFNSHDSHYDNLADQLDYESSKQDDGDEIYMIPKEDVFSFSFIDANGIMLNFEQRDDKWIYVDNESIELNEDRVDKILNYLCDIRCTDTITAADPEGFGLNQDSKEYRVTDYSGNTVIISLGNYDQDKGQQYFAINYDFSTIFINSGKISKVSEYAIQDLVKL